MSRLAAAWSAVLDRKKPGSSPVRKRKNHDLVIAFGMFMASILDPKTRVQTELLDRKDSRDRTEPGRENQ